MPVVSRPGAQGPDGWTGRTGHVGEALHDLFVRGTLAPGSVVAYLCGNPAMVTSVTRVLADAGSHRRRSARSNTGSIRNGDGTRRVPA